MLFRTGGTIALSSEIQIVEPFITVAGQTAPGDGIAIRGAPILIRTHDVVLRGLRIRLGQVAEEDSLRLSGLTNEGDTPSIHHVVVDHCSITWAPDEVASTSRWIEDVTYSWNIIAEGLRDGALHPEGPHGFLFLFSSIERTSERVTMHHNLLANAPGRFPRVQNVELELVHNTIANWGFGAVDVSHGTRLNMIGNRFIAGPDTRDPADCLTIRDPSPPSAHFVAGNISVATPTGAEAQSGLVERYDEVSVSLFDAPVVASSDVELGDAMAHSLRVLESAGATVPRRDAVDARIASDARVGGGQIIDTELDVGGYPTLAAGPAPPDADGDGVDDDWERANGLSPSDPR